MPFFQNTWKISSSERKICWTNNTRIDIWWVSYMFMKQKKRHRLEHFDKQRKLTKILANQRFIGYFSIYKRPVMKFLWSFSNIRVFCCKFSNSQVHILIHQSKGHEKESFGAFGTCKCINTNNRWTFIFLHLDKNPISTVTFT